MQERILKRIHELYEKGLNPGSDGSVGLLSIAADPLLQLKIYKPRKKVNVMLIGNHSAGKSSFINWYIGESVQTTGVAIETRGFTFVTSGRKRDTLKGDATFAFYDHINGLSKFKGISENVFTEISTSKDRNFSCVDLVDSPGLVDGEMEYPFDVTESIVFLADHVDLILCFFDPIGQPPPIPLPGTSRSRRLPRAHRRRARRPTTPCRSSIPHSAALFSRGFLHRR